VIQPSCGSQLLCPPRRMTGWLPLPGCACFATCPQPVCPTAGATWCRERDEARARARSPTNGGGSVATAVPAPPAESAAATAAPMPDMVHAEA
jgi:hypothetical protein